MKNKSLGQIAFEHHHTIVSKWSWEYLKRQHPLWEQCWENSAKAVEREVKRRMKAQTKIGKKGRR